MKERPLISGRNVRNFSTVLETFMKIIRMKRIFSLI